MQTAVIGFRPLAGINYSDYEDNHRERGKLSLPCGNKLN